MAATSRRGGGARRGLSAQDLHRCEETFVAFDGGTGALPLRAVRAALQRMTIYPSEEELFELIAVHDPDGTGALPLPRFVALVTDFKNFARAGDGVDTTTLDAFVALGGNRDQSGVISTDKLRAAVRDDFAIPINIDRLIREADADGSGFIDFEEFSAMLRSGTGD